jgi:transcriptional regulator with GAF, ATPase, and Fis domain
MGMFTSEDNVHADAVQDGWCLRLIDGALAWSTWPLSVEPLLVGRGLGCHVCIEDKAISRAQCEISIREDVPFLRNLSRRTPTLVNSIPCVEAILRFGDVIELAGHKFIIDLAPRDAPAMQPIADNAPTTQQFDESVFLRSKSRIDVDDITPGFTHNVVSLFTLQRSLARAGSLDVLVAELRAHMSEQLGPGDTWMAWRIGSEGEIAIYPPVSSQEQARAPVRFLQKAFVSQEGLLAGSSESNAKTLLAAPLLHGGSAFGAMAIERDAYRGDFTKTQLHYLLAVAEGAAPLIRAAERMEQLQRDRQFAAQTRADKFQLLGVSRIMLDLRERLARTAMGRGNIMLVGETGVGKELAARMIHDVSPRAEYPYVVVNCAAIPDDLFESEVFGHERGSFTGASQPRKGLFEQAHGGTLFLDEVGELSTSNQARLLRAAETGAFRRLGAEKELSVDVRIVSATNRPMLESGHEFRSDLYYRLGGVVIRIPSLRERPEDIPELAHHFLNHFSLHSSARPIGFTNSAIDALTKYHWPGNVRELRNAVERACYAATDRFVTRENILPLGTQLSSRTATGSPRLDDIERSHLLEVLKANDANVSKSAEALGIAASTLYYKLRRHNISLRNPR